MTGWSMSANFICITQKAEWGTVLQRRGKYPTKATLSRLWNPHEGACASWRAEACLRIFLCITQKAEWGTVPQRRGKYPTKAALNRLWNPHEGCVLLMTGWNTSVNFLYITLKAEWGTVLQRRWKYPTKAALSGLWNPVKVRAPHDRLKQVYEFSLYIHTLYTIKIDPAKWIPLTEKACMTRWVWPR